MAKRRKSIRLLEHERQLLIQLYLKWRIPVDQYEARPDDLEGLCEEWRSLCGRCDTNEEILHYMRNQRKNGLWVTFNGDHETAPPLPTLAAEETEILIEIYAEIVAAAGDGSDNIAYDSEIADLIARRFAEATGKRVPAHQLVAKLTAIRKRGLLPPTAKPTVKPTDTGFDDIDQIREAE